MPRALLPPIGWPLLPSPDEAGRLSWPTLEDSIQQNIKVILQTRPGEQLMRPRYGAGLQGYIGQPDTTTTRRRLVDAVKESLTRHETRITVEDVEVEGDPVESDPVQGGPAQPGWVRLEIRYRIRRTGVLRRVGLNLALENG